MLSDIDNDGKLTCEEFCLAMHLVDMSRKGQPMPAKLPPDLIPPSYRRGRSSSQTTSPPSAAVVAPIAVPIQQQGRKYRLLQQLLSL